MIDLDSLRKEWTHVKNHVPLVDEIVVSLKRIF